MLLNLYSNAIKFTERWGTINVMVELLKHTELRISVIDSGIGIKQED